MTPVKRKTQQDLPGLEEQRNIKSPTTKRRSKDEETMFPNETQTVEPEVQQPALTINIHSWATPIVGIIMLVIGSLAGFYARPAVLGQLPQSASKENPAVVVPTADQSEAQQQLMASLIPKVRHFLGDPNASVTIIEFGDFQ